MNKIYFNTKYDFVNQVITKNKTIDLIPIKDENIVSQYNDFSIGSRITGLNGFNKWRDKVLSDCIYDVNEKIAIAQPYKEIYDENDLTVKDLAGFTDRRYSVVKFLKNFIKITKISLCCSEGWTEEDQLKMGIQKGCLFDGTIFSFKTSYYFKDNEKICTFENSKDAFNALLAKLYGKQKNGLFYKIEFELL